MQVQTTEVTGVTQDPVRKHLRGRVTIGVSDRDGAALRWMHFDCTVVAEPIDLPAQKSALIQEAKRQLLRMPEHRTRNAPEPVTWDCDPADARYLCAKPQRVPG